MSTETRPPGRRAHHQLLRRDTYPVNMSTLLDDIWNEPLAKEPSPPRNATAAADEADDSGDGDDMFRPSKRRRSSLFLDDPDEIDDHADILPENAETSAGG